MLLSIQLRSVAIELLTVGALVRPKTSLRVSNRWRLEAGRQNE
jgi:hypothetical protein